MTDLRASARVTSARNAKICTFVQIGTSTEAVQRWSGE
jgi:hypothetical protein